MRQPVAVASTLVREDGKHTANQFPSQHPYERICCPEYPKCKMHMLTALPDTDVSGYADAQAPEV